MPRKSPIASFLMSATAMLLIAACSEPNGADTARGGLAPALVAVATVKPETVTIADELPARVAAFRTAEIRPQVGGIIQKRLFEQGSEVEAGQELFQINAEPFKADVDSAAAALQRAEAGLTRSQTKFDRAKQLVATTAISREAYEDAVAELAQTKANVAEARATLQRRRLDLAFATVRAPIAGRIGQALVSEGALVSASGTNVLALVQQIDRVYVDVKQPSSQIDVIREGAKSGQLDDASRIPVAIFAASGKPYPMTGRALFSDISVEPGTGNVTVRVEVPNPDRILLPGMYVRARLPRGVRRDALLVAQEAVVRDPTGRPQLVIVNDQKHGARRDVELGETVEGRTIITSGLRPGETVVVQGQERVEEGMPLNVTPFGAAAAQN
ncbi:efflux RND transporter periplasmic adaptor subunit [Labrys neptuniae]|uniref:Efflux RND transporter periplasmic adaptor subunit n=1 Tax=Labrys neptuniae TaxID=376174 RepID=A0ABV3PWH2_9HYPH